MAKYRKLPVIIEAYKYNAPLTSSPVWILEALQKKIIMLVDESYNNEKMLINNSKGYCLAYDGYYIIQEIDGEIWCCKPDEFQKMYEEVKLNG